MEQAIISGVAHVKDEAKITVTGVPDRPGVAAELFEKLADAEINIDMIVQNVSSDGRTDISFTAPEDFADLAVKAAKEAAEELGAGDVDVDTSIAKVSLVGAGMKTEPGVAARLFRCMADADINIGMISTSTIRVSVIVDEAQVEAAVRALAEEFDLTEEAPA